MTSRLLTDDIEQLIALKYTNGATQAALSRHYGVSISTISKALRRQGVTSRGYARKREMFTDEEIDNIVYRWSEKLQSKNRIASDYGASVESVYAALLSRGIDPSERRYVTGEDHGNWSGGRWVEPNGVYVWRRVAPSHFLYGMSYSGRILEHRLVMAEYLGRPLESYETVHHIDNDPLNNDLSNLQLRLGNHGKGAAFKCRTCGSHDLIAVPLSE